MRHERSGERLGVGQGNDRLRVSGGAARGDFQLGALRYLADRGIKPDAMATTSVGSVNGLQLAHGDRPGKTAQDALEDIWFTKMNTCGDLFEVSDVTRMIRDRIQGVLSGIQGSVVTGGAAGGIAGLALLGPVGYIIGLLGGAIGGGAVAVDELDQRPATACRGALPRRRPGSRRRCDAGALRYLPVPPSPRC